MSNTCFVSCIMQPAHALHPEAFPAMYDDYASYYLHEAGQEQSADAPV